ncbi:hypothetical protein PI95_021955 [Hassallia byssoidea VB512170]|uniref:Uncharacterized protein n=1 Tax=Hassallia byssoidea VB512170 TaxID=1304833 RepID=A0A846HEC3_9CYAN|nr:hypothetical protein [Hassalia byssoidea]NEU75149.1 hypothetical protein [Hassalia byssoidea VB512170]
MAVRWTGSTGYSTCRHRAWKEIWLYSHYPLPNAHAHCPLPIAHCPKNEDVKQCFDLHH